MDVYVQLGRKVAVARKKLELTQAELAERVSLTRASIANLETGRQRVMLHDVFELVEALECKTILELIPERVPQISVKDLRFEGDQVNKQEERLMLQMIELATGGQRRSRRAK